MPAYEGFPYDLPFVRDLDLSFKRAVTYLVGENGSGKSTLIEAIAEACGNVFIASHYVKLLSMGMRVSHLSLTYERDSRGKGTLGLDNISDEHNQMLDYIMSHDAERAEQVAGEHTVHGRERVLGYLLSTTAPAASSAR